MKIKINKKKEFDTNKPPLIIAEISGNHCGSKKLFLKHIMEAAKVGADLIKIQTYEPNDITIRSKKKFIKLKEDSGKISIYGIYMRKHTHLIIGT